MKSKVSHVKNPLTIIAIFAGISEISATAVLPFISESIQKIFIWFIILFPFFLLVLFFITLWTKHHVLYAPSDFSSDENFLKVIPSTGQEIKEKLIEETNDLKEISQKSVSTTDEVAESIKYNYNEPGFDTSAHENFALAEQLYLNTLRDKYGKKLGLQSTIQSRNMKIRVDGLYKEDDHWYLHEIKYFSSENIQMNGIGKNINNFIKFRSSSTLNKKLTYHIHIVTPVNKKSREIIKQNFYNNFGKIEDVFINVIDYLALRKEYNFD